MNYFPRHKIFPAAAKWLCALLAALALPLNAPAQPTSPERWLLVFDLSPAMKKRLPATEAVVKNFFATSAEGRLQDGDSIGVWTFDEQFHTGQFPLVDWNPNQATALTTNLIGFLRSQKFTSASRLAALQPALASVVAGSERLTVVIFCDGESEITATPYDSGINQSFLDSQAERRKSQQPFVVLIRSLSGKYIGCTVNFPPGTINIPLFLAPPAPTNPPPAVAVVKTSPVVIPSLVIVGTNVGTVTDAPPKISPPAVKPAPVEPPKIIAAATEPSPPKSSLAAVKSILPKVIATTPVMATATNTVATKDEPDSRRRLLILVSGGLLAAAIVLAVVLMVRPGRRPQSSLITSSMEDDPRRK